MSVESNSGALAPSHESTAQQAADFIHELSNGQFIIESAKQGSPWPLKHSRGPKLDSSEALSNALDEPLRQALVEHIMPDDAVTAKTLALLGQRQPAFTEVESGKLSPIMELGRIVFSADKAGLVLRAKLLNKAVGDQNLSIVYGIPALERDGVTYRLLMTPDHNKLPMLSKAFGLLALPTEFNTKSETVLAITEMVPGAEQPTDFTEAEIDEWLSRVEAAGVELNINDFRQTEFLSEAEVEAMLARIRAAGFKLDADKLRQSTKEDNNDKGLDNFLRVDGKLYWCDGDLMLTHEIDAKAMALQIEKWRELMRSFVRPELPQAA